ncbi:hypothetical protein ANANG_G00002680, partial [Anguilla anguilla]
PGYPQVLLTTSPKQLFPVETSACSAALDTETPRRKQVLPKKGILGEKWEHAGIFKCLYYIWIHPQPVQKHPWSEVTPEIWSSPRRRRLKISLSSQPRADRKEHHRKSHTPKTSVFNRKDWWPVQGIFLALAQCTLG